MSSTNHPTSSGGRSGQPHQRTASFPYPQRESSLQNDVTLSASKRPGMYPRNAAAAQSAISIGNTSRSSSRPAQDATVRSQTPTMAARENPRLHPQGFFEPSLPTAANSSFSHQPGTSTLSQSQLAALAAMHVAPQHDRRISQNGSVDQSTTVGAASAPRKATNPPPIQTSQISRPRLESAQSNRAEPRSTAAFAASAAYPRSPAESPADMMREDYFLQSPDSEREQRSGKEKTRRKLFSKPKNIHISKDKDAKAYPLPAPKTAGIYGASGMAQQSQSAISLVDSIYSNPNASTSTLVPSDRNTGVEKDRKHNFLSRQKNKLKDDHHAPLSSASSNSRPADPIQPQYLYNFAPSSPGLGSKSISGFDLRHGGRALREKKKEEKSAAQIPPVPGSGTPAELLQLSSADWPIGSGFSNNPPSTSMQSPHHGGTEYPLTNMSATADDPWPTLRKKLLQVFHRDSEEIRIHIEDLNRLVALHLQRCVARKAPHMMLDDLNELLTTGFHSIDLSLRSIQDERLLVPHLVEIWSFVFTSVLPFLQAVFLPLDLELKGRGTLLSQRDAADFWAGLPPNLRPLPDTSVASSTSTASTSTRAATPPVPPMTDTRTLTLLQMRDTLILPRHNTLLNIFSHLSLESLIHTAPFSSTSHSDMPPPPLPPGMQQRPSTAGSNAGNLDPSSFTSQTSTLLDSTGGSSNSLGARSRATSNTSAGSFASVTSAAPGRFAPVPTSSSSAGTTVQGSIRAVGLATAAPLPAPLDSAKITQTAAKMLQCLSVLASLRGLGSNPSTRDPASVISPIASPERNRARSSTGSGSTATATATTAGAGGGSGAGTAEPSEERELVARRMMEQLSKELKLNWLGRGRTGRNRRGLVGGRRTPGVGVGVGVAA